MNKEIRAEVQRRCGLDKAACSLLLSGLERVFQEAMIRMSTVSMEGLGTFVPHKHPEYVQESPSTGEVLLYPPRITCRFQSSGEAPSATLGLPTVDTRKLAELVADYVKMPTEAAWAYLQALAAVTSARLQAGEEVTWTNFGTFRVVSFCAGENHRIAWNVDEKMRDLINAPFSCFEPIVVGHMEVPATPRQELPGEPETVAAVEAPAPVDDAAAPVVNASTSADEALHLSVDAPSPAEAPLTAEAPATVAPQLEAEAPADDAPQTEVAAEVAAPEVSAPDPIAPDVSASEPAKKGAKRHKTFVAWTFGVLILLCLLFIYNICARHTVATEPTGTESVASESTADVAEPIEAEVAAAEAVDATEEAQTAATESEATQTEATEATQTAATEEAQIAATEEAQTVATEKPAPAQGVKFYQLDAHGNRMVEVVQPDDRLTLMAYRLYGHKAFWVYIYEVNKDRLTSPDNVTTGMKLYLPNPAYWQIDATSETSVQTALRRASKLVH